MFLGIHQRQKPYLSILITKTFGNYSLMEKCCQIVFNKIFLDQWISNKASKKRIPRYTNLSCPQFLSECQYNSGETERYQTFIA